MDKAARFGRSCAAASFEEADKQPWLHPAANRPCCVLRKLQAVGSDRLSDFEGQVDFDDKRLEEVGSDKQALVRDCVSVGEEAVAERQRLDSWLCSPSGQNLQRKGKINKVKIQKKKDKKGLKDVGYGNKDGWLQSRGEGGLIFHVLNFLTAQRRRIFESICTFTCLRRRIPLVRWSRGRWMCAILIKCNRLVPIRLRRLGLVRYGCWLSWRWSRCSIRNVERRVCYFRHCRRFL